MILGGIILKIMQNETSSGGLKMGVFAISVARPIENAVITITSLEENVDDDQQRELITDISGQTDTIYLPCPPIDYSLSPDMPRPFSTYNITVYAEGFIPAYINGVQIFADIVAIQNVSLTPLIEEESEQKNIDIPYPTLWGDFPEKIPEDSEKDISPESGFVVLDRPVVPEYIVVHDGNPNDDTAPNYYIEFKDYIKNVASCEIYSTWPDAAIRANILVIISFTLNRVFTEWYRNKGKNFTITSSTAYVKKRNILYKSLSIFSQKQRVALR